MENDSKKSPRKSFWARLYEIFNKGNGNGRPAPGAMPHEDAFDAIHREFLWLKDGQIEQWARQDGNDPLWKKNARAFFHQDFIDALTQESIGGNAGAGHTGINAFYNPITGEIKHFGNFQDIKSARWDEITGSTTVEGDFHCLFRINVQHTGKIAEVIFEQKPLSDLAHKRISTLVGFQVMIPFTQIYQALKSTEHLET